jgi:CyaY protein
MADFTTHYDATRRELETRLSEAIDQGSDFDFDTSGDVIKIEFTDGEKFVVSPNSPVEQLWISANYAGTRFNWSEEAKDWLSEKSQESVFVFLANAISQKLGEDVTL